jgi:hypothetical protein
MVLTSACLSPATAVAHSLNVECRVTADALEVVASFGRSKRPARDAAVELKGAEGVVVAQGRSGPDGVCRLPRPDAGRYLVSVEALDHKSAVEVIVPEVDAQAAGGLKSFRPRPPAWQGWAPWVVCLAVGAVGIVLAACWLWGRRGRRGSSDSETPTGQAGAAEDSEPTPAP